MQDSLSASSASAAQPAAPARLPARDWFAAHHAALIFYLLWLALTVFWILIRLRQYASFNFTLWTLSLYANVVSNTLHGAWLDSSVMQFNHLGTHFSPIMALFAPLYALLGEDPRVLMLAQVIVPFAAAPLLFALGRRLLAPHPLAGLAAACIALGFLCYEPLLRAVIDDFHPSTLAPLPILGAILALHARRPLAFWVSVAALLLIKESGALIVFSLALYAWLELRQRRTALIAVAVAGLCFSLWFFILMPHFNTENWHQASRVDPWAWFSADLNRQRLVYLARVFWPVAFLPLLRPRAMVWLAPQILLNLITNYPNQLSARSHYDDAVAPLLYVALLHSFRDFAVHDFKIAPRTKSAALALVAVVLPLIALFASRSQPWRLHRQFEPKPWHVALHAAVAPYAALSWQQPIRAPGRLAALVANRHGMSARQTELDKNDFQPGDIILLAPRLGKARRDKSFVRSQALIEANRDRLEIMQQDDVLWAFRVR